MFRALLNMQFVLFMMYQDFYFVLTGGGYWHQIILLRDYSIIFDFVASAYCGGMWLAALRMMIEMATILKKEDDVLHYKEILDKGKVSYQNKLWNGKFHRCGISFKDYG